MVRVGVVQSAPVRGNVEATLAQMEAWIGEAGLYGRRVNVLVFPELFVTGYLPELWVAPPTLEEVSNWQQRITHLAAKNDIWIVYGHPAYKVDNAPEHPQVKAGLEAPLYNAASLISPTGVVGTYGKVHLFGNEPATFMPGAGFPVWETPFGRVAIQICYDLEFPESARMAALSGAQWLLIPANNMAPYGPFHATYTMARALENNLFVVTVNRIEPELDIDFCGGSCAAHPEHRWLIEPTAVAGLHTCDVEVAELDALHASLDYGQYRRPDLYGRLTESTRT